MPQCSECQYLIGIDPRTGAKFQPVEPDLDSINVYHWEDLVLDDQN